MTNPLLIALHDGTLTLTLNRPERHNAFDGALIAALDAAFITAERDPAVRLVVLAAAGRSFCAGAANSLQARLAPNCGSGRLPPWQYG